MKEDLLLEIRNDYLKGLSISEISRKYNINWRTAKKYSVSEKIPKYTLRNPKSSKLDEYKPMLKDLLEEAPYNAVRLYEKIQEHGFAGKIGIVRDYVKTEKKKLNTKATVRFLYGDCRWGLVTPSVDWSAQHRYKLLFVFFLHRASTSADCSNLWLFRAPFSYSFFRHIFKRNTATNPSSWCNINYRWCSIY